MASVCQWRCFVQNENFWSSIKALHWMTSFLDPTFKSMQFLPQTNREEAKFKRNLLRDLDDWLLTEMTTADHVSQSVFKRQP